jgi:hypothetical protein
MDVFTVLFALLFALLYLFLIRTIRSALLPQSVVNEMRAALKEVTELMKQGKSEEEIVEAERRATEKLNAFSVAQLKVVLAFTVFFFLYIHVVALFDPAKNDDIRLSVGKNLSTITIPIPQHARCGMWYVEGYSKGLLGEGTLFSLPFYVCNESEGDVWVRKPQWLDVKWERVVQPGENLTLTFNTSLYLTHLSLNNGTRIFVDLPFTLPIINVHRVYDFTGLFLLTTFLMSFVTNRVFKYLEGLYGKAKGQDAESG